jgi:hypothetical protein
MAMIEYIKLNKNGTFESRDENHNYLSVITKSELNNYSSVPLKLEDGITLEEVLKAYPPVYDLILWRFDEHLKELEEPQLVIKRMPPFKILELERLVIIKDGSTLRKGGKSSKKTVKPSVELVDFFHGTGFDTKGNKITYDLTMLPLNLIKSYPVAIKHRVEANMVLNGKLLVIESEELESYNPSILEVYNNLVCEITWHGSPDDRAKAAEKFAKEHDKKDIN